MFGPRGSGKSTLLRSLFAKEDVLWIDLLDQRLDFELAANPEQLLTMWKLEKPKWIVIDEVQKNPRLLDVVHAGIERHRIRFALTGSSARKLKRGGANLLGDRVASYKLGPFNSLELGDRFDLDQALATGCLPRFWTELDDEADRVRSLYSYGQTYLREEVAAEQLVRNLEPFRRFLIAAAQSNSKIVNFSALERDAGVAPSQAHRHFEVLEDTLLSRFLEPFDTSIRKRQTKQSKFYFFDTGVVRAIRNMAGEVLNQSTYEYGELFETFVINEFFKLNEAREKRLAFSYFRTKDNVEIDLVVEPPRGKPKLVEIKSSKKLPTSKELRNMKSVGESLNTPFLYWLSNSPTEAEIEGVRCLNWQTGLKEILES